MNKLRFLLCVFLMAVAGYAGEVADKQMDKVEKFLKKSRYKEAATALLDYGLNMADEQKVVGVTQYAGCISRNLSSSTARC